MAVKPNRGVVSFFVLLAIVVAGYYGYGRHAQSSFHTDAPPAYSTRRLLRCLLGRDAQRVLGDRPGSTDRDWAARATDRLRVVIAQEHGADWPSRCAGIADRLSQRLASDGARARRAEADAMRVRDLLNASAADPIAGIASVENGSLGTALASLAFEVSALSVGAEQGWNSQLPYAATDLFPIDAAPTPPLSFSEGAEYVTLVLPDLLLYQSVADRRLHVVTFDGNERPTDRAIGRGAPVGRTGHEGMALIADDGGDSLFLPGGEPAQLVPLPHTATNMHAGPDDWQVALTSSLLWLLIDDDGVLRVWNTARSGEVAWHSVAEIGEPDSMLTGLLVPAPDADTVNVVAFRRGALGVRVDGYTLNTDGLAHRAPEALISEWPSFGAQAATCRAGRERFALLVSDTELRVVATDGTHAVSEGLALDSLGATAGGEFALSCSEDDVLIFAKLHGGSAKLVRWRLDRAAGLHEVTLPQPNLGALVGGAVAPNHGLIALLDNGHALRAIRGEDVDGDASHEAARWTGGTLILLETAPDRDVPDDAVRQFVVDSVAAQGSHIALLGRQREGRTVTVGRFGSHDAGRTFLGAP